jgi:hypothetical protein
MATRWFALLVVGCALPMGAQGAAASYAVAAPLSEYLIADEGAKLVMEGKTKEQIDVAVKAAWAKGGLVAPSNGAMSYMLSKQQYVGDEPKSWHRHLMWFVAGDAVKSWGADAKGSPVMGFPDPADRMTILMLTVDHWSDGTMAPAM